MPPRWLCVLIVASWLLLTGWLLYRDLLPRLLPGQPPPFTIDLVEEAETKRAPLSWTVQRNGGKGFTARTHIEHPSRDVFELIAEFPTRSESLSVNAMRVHSVTSIYRVNSAGDLLGLEVRFSARLEAVERTDIALPRVGDPFSATISGEMDGSRLSLTKELPAAEGKPPRRLQSTELEVGQGAGLVMPLHPPKRLRGIRPGQSWSAVVLDPFAYFVFAGEPLVVRAKVRPQVVLFTWGRRSEVPCLVIDYEGDQVKVSTWVSREDGSVLCQEATLDRTRWALYRN
jgi:hypothetical protein